MRNPTDRPSCPNQREIEMVINLKLEKPLDVIVSLRLLGRADEMANEDAVLLQCVCRFLALLRSADGQRDCLLIGAERKSSAHGQNDATLGRQSLRWRLEQVESAVGARNGHSRIVRDIGPDQV